MTPEERKKKVDKAYEDFLEFKAQGKNEYAAVAVRTITECIVGSYVEYFTPEVLQQENPSSIMDQLVALSKCQSFRQDQIALLHTMRKIGNAGAHQGERDSFELSDFHISNAASIVEDVIIVWKDWLDADYEQRLLEQKSAKKALSDAKRKQTLQEEIKYSAIVLTIIGVIVYFTVGIHIGFFKEGLSFYLAAPVWPLYAGFVLLTVTAFCCRRHGVFPRIICDMGMLYFLVPRLYLAYLSRDYFTDSMIFIFLSFGMVIIYSTVCIKSVEMSKGYEIKGYN